MHTATVRSGPQPTRAPITAQLVKILPQFQFCCFDTACSLHDSQINAFLAQVNTFLGQGNAFLAQGNAFLGQGCQVRLERFCSFINNAFLGQGNAFLAQGNAFLGQGNAFLAQGNANGQEMASLGQVGLGQKREVLQFHKCIFSIGKSLVRLLT